VTKDFGSLSGVETMALIPDSSSIDPKLPSLARLVL